MRRGQAGFRVRLRQRGTLKAFARVNALMARQRSHSKVFALAARPHSASQTRVNVLVARRRRA